MSIVIDVEDTWCWPGSTISGTVSLRGSEDVDVQDIAICLIARCKTKIEIAPVKNRTAKYRGRAPLIYIRQELFTGPHTLHPGHSWPFSFTLPERCTAVRADPFKAERGAFNLDHNQTLPPEFMSYKVSFGYAAESFISYQLEASLRVSRRKLFSSGDLQSIQSLHFTTLRDVDIPELQFRTMTWYISCASLLLEPGRENDSLTLMEKLKSLCTSRLPTACFAIKMELPKVGVPDENLPVILSVEHDIQMSSAYILPLVILKKCSLYLRAHTHIQAIRNERSHPGDIERKWDETHEIAHCDFQGQMNRAPSITEDVDLQQFMEVVIPYGHSPSFSTFNIRRYYTLGIRLSVQCAQKTFESVYEIAEFTLLSANYASSGSATVVDETAPDYASDQDTPLPRYEDDHAGIF